MPAATASFTYTIFMPTPKITDYTDARHALLRHDAAILILRFNILRPPCRLVAAVRVTCYAIRHLSRFERYMRCLRLILLLDASRHIMLMTLSP